MLRSSSNLVSVVFALLSATAAICAEPRIELHIYTEDGLPAGSEQDWYQLLTPMGAADLQFRGATAGQRTGIATRGSATEPTYRVTGLLTARNELVVPGGKFTLRDRPRISAWIQRLREAGPEVANAARKLPFDYFKSAQRARFHKWPELTKASPSVDLTNKLKSYLNFPDVSG